VWFYDLNAHRWICIHPGTDVASFTRVMDKNGFEATADGQNIPIASAVHGYECTAYVTDERKFMTLQTGSPYSKKLMERRKTWLKDAKITRESGRHPFFYDVASGRWERVKAAGSGPTPRFSKALTYVPTKKQAYYYGRGDTFWSYDVAAKKWSLVKPKGDPPKIKKGHEGTICYDSKRDRFYIFNATQLSIPWVYDIQANTFSDPQARNQPYPGLDYRTGYRLTTSTTGGVHYDTVHDVVVLRLSIKQGEGDPRNIRGKTLGLAIYDPKTNEWRKEIAPLPPKVPRGSWNSFYDPTLNVHVYHVAGDSRTNGVIWLYRYKKAPEKK
jgi:hypothetical protein